MHIFSKRHLFETYKQPVVCCFNCQRFGHRANNCLLESTCENSGKPSRNHPCKKLQFVSTVKGTTNPLQTLVQPLLFFLKTLPSPIKIMKILQLNVVSLQTSHNQLKFYQEQSESDIIALQETNVKDKLEIFKN